MKQSKINKAFKLPSENGVWSGPTTCIDCGSKLKNNSDWDYNSEWWISKTCTICGQKWRYMPSDMGQTLPQLERYKSRKQTKREEERWN